MKLRECFVMHEVAGEWLLVPTTDAGFPGIMRGNKVFGAILSQLAEETTEDQIILALKARFDAPRQVIERDVSRALKELRAAGALEGE